jgi:hypothetical protein
VIFPRKNAFRKENGKSSSSVYYEPIPVKFLLALDLDKVDFGLVAGFRFEYFRPNHPRAFGIDPARDSDVPTPLRHGGIPIFPSNQRQQKHLLTPIHFL